PWMAAPLVHDRIASQEAGMMLLRIAPSLMACVLLHAQKSLDEAYLRWNVAPADQAYSSIDGQHLKGYVGHQAAISTKYHAAGHQFWGRIGGTEADEENAQWLMDKFRDAGLSDVHQQMFDLPPQWMPQSWSVSATSADGKTLALETAQPTYRSPGSDSLDLEAV